MNNIIVFCETDNGKLCDVSLELLTKARSLAQTLNCDLEALLIGYNVENLQNELYQYGVKRIHLADDKQLEFFRTLPYASIAISLLQKGQNFVVGSFCVASSFFLPIDISVFIPFISIKSTKAIIIKFIIAEINAET